MHVEEIKKRISDVTYCFVNGEAGSGKSISIYQVAYDLYKIGWTVYKFVNCDDNCFDLPIFLEEKVLLIIDDSQNLKR